MARIKSKYYVVGPTPFATTKPNGLEAAIMKAIAAAGKMGLATSDVWSEASKFYPSCTPASVSSTLVAMKKKGFVRFLGQPVPQPIAVETPVEELEVKALATFEELLVAKAKKNDLPLDSNDAYQMYAKVKPAYLGRRDKPTVEEQTECAAFFRKTLVELIKTIF